MANSGFNIAPAALADIIVADLRPKLPVLDMFTTLAQSREDRGTTIDVPFIAGDDAATFSKASGGYKDAGSVQVTKASVSLTHYHATRSFDASELAAWGAEGVINAFKEEAVAKIVKKANSVVNALVTNANYSSNIVIAAADFDYNDVVDLDTALDDLLAPEQRGLVLNSTYIGALRKDAKLTSAFNTQGNNSVVRTGIVGQIGTLQVMQYAGLSANGENLVGFAAAKDAICIGTGSVWSSGRVMPRPSGAKKRSFSASRSRRVMAATSRPSTSIVPASGGMRPRMHFSSTDFPVPEPPMMTMLSPLGMVRSTPRSTRLGPKDLWTEESSIMR